MTSKFNFDLTSPDALKSIEKLKVKLKEREESSSSPWFDGLLKQFGVPYEDRYKNAGILVDEAQDLVTISDEHGTAWMTTDFYEKAMNHPVIIAGAGMSLSGLASKLLSSEPITVAPKHKIPFWANNWRSDNRKKSPHFTKRYK